MFQIVPRSLTALIASRRLSRTLAPADLYLGDANFNITTLVSTVGDAVERFVHSPYGVLTINGATWANTRSASSYTNAYTGTGRQLDTKTRLYHYRARLYAAQLGRFCSRDPIGYRARTANLFEYGHASPALHTDASGHLAVSFRNMQTGYSADCIIASSQ